MKNRIWIILALFIFSSSSIGQTYATDFTANDCEGVSHNLFSELDSGKVVVIAWTMPCFTCIAPCLSAHDAAVSFDASNPGEVLFYLADDYGGSSCSSLVSWGGTNGFSHATTFFSDPVVDMTDYGLEGMPKVIVIGCNGGTREVFYNQNNLTDFAGVQAGISTALAAGTSCTLGINDATHDDLAFSLYPNPTTNKTNVRYNLKTATTLTLDIISSSGAIVQTISTEIQNTGNYSYELETSSLSEGIYFIRITTETAIETKRLVVTK